MSETDEGDDKTMIMSPSAIRRLPAPKALLTCVDTSVLESASGVRIELEEGETTVGRGNENDVPLKADGISRKHARIFPADDCWGIEDLGSTNGVRVNNSKVTQTFLKDGDTVAIGRVCYKFEIIPDASASASETTGSHHLDLGEDKTMIMAPPKRAQATAAASEPAGVSQPRAHSAPASRPAAGAAAKPAAKPAARPAAKKSGSGNGLLWVLVVVGIALLGGAVYLML